MSKALNVIDKFEDLDEQGFTGSGSCRCPRCGTTQPHLPGNPCRMKVCPKCKIPLARTVRAGEGIEEQQLKYFRFELDNGNIISIEATSEEEARERAEDRLKRSKIVKSLGEQPHSFPK